MQVEEGYICFQSRTHSKQGRLLDEPVMENIHYFSTRKEARTFAAHKPKGRLGDWIVTLAEKEI